MGWMTHVVESEKLPNPEDVALFGPDAVVQIPDAFTDATKDGRRREQGVFRSPHNVVAHTVRKDSTTTPSGRILAVRIRRTGELCGSESVLNGRGEWQAPSVQINVRRHIRRGSNVEVWWRSAARDEACSRRAGS